MVSWSMEFLMASIPFQDTVIYTSVTMRFLHIPSTIMIEWGSIES